MAYIKIFVRGSPSNMYVDLDILFNGVQNYCTVIIPNTFYHINGWMKLWIYKKMQMFSEKDGIDYVKDSIYILKNWTNYYYAVYFAYVKSNIVLLFFYWLLKIFIFSHLVLVIHRMNCTVTLIVMGASVVFRNRRPPTMALARPSILVYPCAIHQAATVWLPTAADPAWTYFLTWWSLIHTSFVFAFSTSP